MTDILNPGRENTLYYRIRTGPKHYYQSYEMVRYRQERAAKNPFDGASVLMVVFLLLMMVAVLVVYYGDSIVSKNILYDEVLTEYAEMQYSNEFSVCDNYENNILLVYLFDEDREEYKTTVRIGKNIAPEITTLFEGETSVYSEAIEENLQEFFLGGYYGIEDDISNIVAVMYDRVEALNLKTNFIGGTNFQSDFVSHLTDPYSITYEQESLNAILEAFTATTGIPVVVTIDYLENVFDVKYSLTEEGIMIVLFAAVMLIVCIVFIALYFINLRKRIKKEKDDQEKEIREKYGAPLGEGIE